MRYFFNSASLGSVITLPLKPSAISISPSLTESVTPLTDRTAGIPIALASIALWLVTPPTSVIIAATFSLLICDVIDGVKSFAISTDSGATAEMSTFSVPRRIDSRLSLMSFTSDARWRVNSSSTPENISMNILHTVATPASATEPESILSSI